MERQEKDNMLSTSLVFKSFSEAIAFIIRVALLAEKHDHHPDILHRYKHVELILTTHDEGNIITTKDRKLAEAISELPH